MASGKPLIAPRLDLNPSSADRWTTCTASPHFVKENWDKLPPNGNAFSEEGTTAHEVAAAMLEDREPNPKECPTPINGEMRMHAFDYAEYVNSLAHGPHKRFVEQKFPLWYMPERNAKIDVALLTGDGIHIVDYKYGEGIVVSPVENLQGAIYARSVVPHMGSPIPDDFPVHIHIYQPRGRDITQPHHTWESTWAEIVEFTSVRVEKPSRLILRPKGSDDWGDVKFAPSDKACQWCPAKGFCSARQAALTGRIEALAVIDESPKHLPPAQALSVAQIAAVLQHGDAIQKWIDDVSTYATDHLKGGGKIPGFKLVLSRGGNRFWTDPKKAAELLVEQTILKREEVIEEKVIGPAAVEKKLGKNKLSVDLLNLIDKPSGSQVIAPEDDKRESLLLDGASEFDALPPHDFQPQ